MAPALSGVSLSVEERVADHLHRRVLFAADGAYLRERGVGGDDLLDLLQRLFRRRRAGVRSATVEQEFAPLDPAVILQLQVEDSGAQVFQVFRVPHRPVTFEIPFVVELRLIYPDRHEMRGRCFAERLKRRLVGHPVLLGLPANVGNCPQQKFFAGGENEPAFQLRESDLLLLTPVVSLDVAYVIDCPTRRLALFEVVFALKELSGRELRVAERRDDDQVQTPDVVNGDGGAVVCDGAERGQVERKTRGVVELLPSREELVGQVAAPHLLVIDAFQIALLQRRLVPLFDRRRQVFELRVNNRPAREVVRQLITASRAARRNRMDRDANTNQRSEQRSNEERTLDDLPIISV